VIEKGRDAAYPAGPYVNSSKQIRAAEAALEKAFDPVNRMVRT